MKNTKKCTYCKEVKNSAGFYHSRCKDCERERKREYEKLPSSRWKKYRRDADRRGLKFLLSESQFISFDKKPCGYCGERLDKIRLDRVDNKFGYFMENVIPCCFGCNSLKHSLGYKEFLDRIAKIYLYQENGKKDGKQKNYFKKTGETFAFDPEGIWTGSRYSFRYNLRRAWEWRRGFFSWLRQILSL